MSKDVSSQSRHDTGIPRQVRYTKSTAEVSAARKALLRYARIVVVVDAVVLVLSAAIGLFSRFSFASVGPREIAYASLSIGVSLAVLGFQGAYGLEGLHTLRTQNQSVTRAAPVVFASIAAFSYASKDQFSRGYLLIFAAIAYGFLLAARWTLQKFVQNSSGSESFQRRTLLVGPNDGSAAELSAAQMEFVAWLPGLGDTNFDEWLEHLIVQTNQLGIDVVILSQSHDLQPKHIQRLSWALEGSIDLVEIASLASLGRRAFLRIEHGVGFLHLVEIQLTGPKRLLKRLFDIIFSIVVLILLSPLVLGIALAVKFTSRGPVFFAQTRVGLNGTLFACLKFRSMYEGAEADQQKVWAEAKALGLGINKHPYDPRVTPVGAFLRKWSLDELPQFLNVLAGSMSVVGPRPIQIVEIEESEVEHKRRLTTKPGLTGLWQISGRSETTWQERIAFDVHYVESWTLGSDFRIVLKTIVAIFQNRGAM